jgi:hypothetical protein
MKTTCDTKWKMAAAGLLVGMAVLAYQLWQERTSERYYRELARAAVAQLHQQAQGAGGFLIAKNMHVANPW